MKHIEKLILIAFSLFVVTSNLYAQKGVSIGKNGQEPNKFARLEVVASDKGVLIPRVKSAERLAIKPDNSANGLLVYDTDSAAFYFYSAPKWIQITASNTLSIRLSKNADSLILNNGVGAKLPDASATNELQYFTLKDSILILSHYSGDTSINLSKASIRISYNSVKNRLYINRDSVDLSYLDDGDHSATNELQDLLLTGNSLTLSNSTKNVDLTPYLDNTDAQSLTLTGSSLAISNGNSVDLTPFINTDKQTLTLTGTDLAISNGNSVDLSGLQDADGNPTNELQDLSLTGNDLTLSNSTKKVDLTPYLDNTDAQSLTLTGSSLAISNGNSVDLSGLQDADGNPTNELQDLSLTGNDLTLSNSTKKVDLTPYLDNTDAQSLTLTGSSLAISNGNSVDLSGLQDADGDPTNEIQDLQLIGGTLKITKNASATGIDLAPFLGTNTDNQTLTYASATQQLSISGGNSVDLSSLSIETDPIFGASVAKGITATNITNWNTAYGWGDHSLVGYLKSYTETDPVFGASVAKGITATNITNWNTAYGWGDHSLAGYLKSYTETDPIFSASAAKSITATKISNWDAAYSWGDHSLAGYLKSYTETDPIFGASVAKGITATNITNWNTAYGWGDHSLAGYLKSYTETDPIFGASVAKGITATNITNWNTAYGWGDHSLAGYLKSYTETDPIFGASVAKGITATNISNWNTAYGWGDHSLAGYLKSYTETDPIFGASVAKGITATNITNWNTAYGWGDHSLAGYLKSYTETDPIFGASAAKGITATNITNWNTAYGWGDHSLAGYLKSYTETDPIFDASVAKGITATNISNWNTAYGWGDHSLAGYLKSYTETDPIFGASVAKGISATDTTRWGKKSNFSGDYDDLSNKPTVGLTTNYVSKWGTTSFVNSQIQDNGTNVAIGAAPNASYKLYVNGRLKSAGVDEISDGRLKTNIRTLEPTLPKIMQLRGVRYDWNRAAWPEKNLPKNEEIGFIAQELELQFPELVTTDADGFKTVQYSRVVAVLLQSVKELTALVQTQQQQIASLQGETARLQNLENQVHILNSQVELLSKVLQASK